MELGQDFHLEQEEWWFFFIVILEFRTLRGGYRDGRSWQQRLLVIDTSGPQRHLRRQGQNVRSLVL